MEEKAVSAHACFIKWQWLMGTSRELKIKLLISFRLETHLVKCEHHFVKFRETWAGEMAKWVTAGAAKCDNLSSVPRTHTVGGELSPASCPLASTCVPWCSHA